MLIVKPGPGRHSPDVFSFCQRSRPGFPLLPEKFPPRDASCPLVLVDGCIALDHLFSEMLEKVIVTRLSRPVTA